MLEDSAAEGSAVEDSASLALCPADRLGDARQVTARQETALPEVEVDTVHHHHVPVARARAACVAGAQRGMVRDSSDDSAEGTGAATTVGTSSTTTATAR